MDIVLYGERGLIAIEVKRSARVNTDTLKGLFAFLDEYPTARTYLLYGGERKRWEGKTAVVPVEDFLKQIDEMLR